MRITKCQQTKRWLFTWRLETCRERLWATSSISLSLSFRWSLSLLRTPSNSRSNSWIWWNWATDKIFSSLTAVHYYLLLLCFSFLLHMCEYMHKASSLILTCRPLPPSLLFPSPESPGPLCHPSRWQWVTEVPSTCRHEYSVHLLYSVALTSNWPETTEREREEEVGVKNGVCIGR